jgi:hypothetical protein
MECPFHSLCDMEFVRSLNVLERASRLISARANESSLEALQLTAQRCTLGARTNTRKNTRTNTQTNTQSNMQSNTHRLNQAGAAMPSKWR